MFKTTPPLSINLRRLPLTTKRGPNKGYYKGNRTGTVGTHNKWGGFQVDLTRVRTYVVPSELDICQLTPFVDSRVEKPSKDPSRRGMSWSKRYLLEWKEKNGQD